jgi:sugar/nucleoside kinase (ribokinase family)
LDNTPISDEITRKFRESISQDESSIVVFSDFRHGIFHKQNIASLTESINPKSFKAADSQVASRWGNICDFVGFDLITPNEREARFSAADQDSTIGPLAGKLFELTNCKNLILKLGDKGLIALARDHENESPKVISMDSIVEDVLDPVGAGDALMAYAVLTLKISGSLPMAAIVGTIAAACETELDGNIPIRRQDILEKLEFLEKRMGYSN